MESYEPVEIAVSGMSPCADVDGMFRSPTALFAAAVADVKRNSRRQRPSWMTIGIRSEAPLLLLTGTLVRVNVPSKFVFVDTSGLPETSAPHCWHWTLG